MSRERYCHNPNHNSRPFQLFFLFYDILNDETYIKKTMQMTKADIENK